MNYTMSIPPELIAKVREEAAREGAKRGKPMPVSEWIREAVTAKLSKA